MIFMVCDLIHVGVVAHKETYEIEVVKTEEVEPFRYLTKNDFSKLYSFKPEVRIKDDSIVEVTQDEATLLMEVARAEGGTTYLGQLWIMCLIINRVNSPNFPDTITEVIFEDEQFEVVSKKTYLDADVNANTHLALAKLEMGWNDTHGALYVESNTNSDESWHKQNLTFIREVEGNLYYK